jgi:hypothetical protein
VFTQENFLTSTGKKKRPQLLAKYQDRLESWLAKHSGPAVLEIYGKKTPTGTRAKDLSAKKSPTVSKSPQAQIHSEISEISEIPENKVDAEPKERTKEVERTTEEEEASSEEKEEQVSEKNPFEKLPKV